ncbi:hypothetical protein [Pontibacter sp. G13]|uniref:hypothetical protein n=1 Tax=Pontibacter sp. G13 TaxID=3074898 RepID=UPI00288C203A|nr:hypothetical protein [Pontibacter sp. G13]WNJ16434.1 hypothetical protein RJD25_16335 [Pontibacter sp. G13]
MMGERILKALLFGIVCLVVSCSTKLENILEGGWTVQKLIYKGESYMPILMSNVLVFNDNGSVMCFRVSEVESYRGSYQIIHDNGLEHIRLCIPDNPFDDMYEISFHLDQEKQLLIMHLENENSQIDASKMLFNFGKDLHQVPSHLINRR